MSKQKNQKIEKKTDRKFFLSVGRLTKQKNFKYLINETSKFFKKNENFDLYIVGEGEKRDELQNLINKNNLNNRIFLIGFSNNVYAYMKNASLFILSSLWEDPGFVIIEAATCNLSVLSSNCPNGPKEFLMNGDAGRLFETNKKGSLLYELENYEDDFKKKVFAKKNSMKYTNFRHFKKLKAIIT
ncbi:glycosyltransferase [Candidatus Pelagibacter sp.]|nr:glycosyltransferase [Candidatus Pelagibacter sp.]